MKRIYLQKAKNQIARPNTIRDINKQIVLNYVRERSPISRAEIARETDLQRSTILSSPKLVQPILPLISPILPYIVGVHLNGREWTTLQKLLLPLKTVA